MPNPRTAAEWADIEARHVKVEDVIYDGPVCRTCRHIDGAAVSYPCDAAVAFAHARQRVAAALEQRLPCWLVWTLSESGQVVLRGIYLSREQANVARKGAEHERQWIRSYIEASTVNHMYAGDLATKAAALRTEGRG